jgi:hypothetical protein
MRACGAFLFQSLISILSDVFNQTNRPRSSEFGNCAISRRQRTVVARRQAKMHSISTQRLRWKQKQQIGREKDALRARQRAAKHVRTRDDRA